MDSRAELSHAAQAVEGVSVETDAPGCFWNRNEISGGLLSTDLIDPWVRKRRGEGIGVHPLSVPKARHSQVRETAIIAPPK